MALLHYENLTGHRPDILMRKTVDGLQDFYKFLDTTKHYLESEKAVKRLGWQSAERTKSTKEQSGFWIQLTEPENVTESVESNFKLFLDENNKEVYEASYSNWVSVGSASRECSSCKQRNGKPKVAYQSKAHAAEIAESSNIELSIYECPDGQGWHLTRDLRSKVSFHATKKITILDRDPENEQLKLDRLPSEGLLVLRPNTYQIMCQIRAVQSLQNEPSQIHPPLLRLFEASDHAEWPDVGKIDWFGNRSYQNAVNDWYVLTDEGRPGTNEQRQWVEVAINTPDFAFLEGPPGSGKTTAICELVIQLALRGKRTLLCASTHVAVDNVLERLMDEQNALRDSILPIRIGDSSNVSEKAKPWQLEEFLRTERTRLLSKLRDLKKLSTSQKELLDQLRAGRDTVQKLVLESSNLVCGTTIGILQHPDIKNRGEQSPQFDVMIIDEASKTTFQEFLVPALLAKRWVLVGDPKQLSPYVDDESTAINIEPCLPEKFKREACLDVFRASIKNTQKRVTTLVGCEDPKVIDYYEKQSKSVGILACAASSNSQDINYSDIVIGDYSFLNQSQEQTPLDVELIRNPELVPESIKRKAEAYCRSRKKDGKALEGDTWESEISWRLARLYEQRLNDELIDSDTEHVKRSTSEKLNQQIKQLLPYEDAENRSEVWSQIDRVRRVSLPSVLESLQDGFERGMRQKVGTALSDGIPKHIKEQRSIRLTWQHRMHPDIADFSHEHIYKKGALFSTDGMQEKRQWTYRSGSKRCVWQDVRGAKSNSNSNHSEVDQMIEELKSFDEWAKNNPNFDRVSGRLRPWEVAILTFYRGQERALRAAVRRWIGNKYGFRHFSRGNKKEPYLGIQICTVDRFQGHEADLVLLGFTSPYPTSFLESPNRLNVAITRARYQLVIFGNRNGMKRASGLLGQFAESITWEKTLKTKSTKGSM